MRRLSFRLALFAVALAAAVAPAANTKTATKATFKDTVNAHFDRWVKGAADGKLSAARVNALVDSKEIKDEEAAAVAAIHMHFRSHKTATALTKAEILAAAGQKNAEERRDVTAKREHYDSNFSDFRHHLSSVPRQVFAGDAPRRVGMSQGNLGDCYVVSAIGAAVSLRPQQVKSMIQVHADGSCDVTFHGAGRVHVPPLTDAQIVLGSKAGDQGLWLNVLEEAFGEVGMARAKGRGKGASPGGGPAVAIDAISHGGDEAKSVEVLSGHAAHTISIRKGKAEAAPNAAEHAKLTAELRQLFKIAVGHRLVVCSVSDKGKYPPGIVTGHAYAVIGYDGSDKVTIWNPWGQHFTPKGTPGMANGYAIEHGEFTLPVSDFVSIFESVSYETDAPIMHRK